MLKPSFVLLGPLNSSEIVFFLINEVLRILIVFITFSLFNLIGI